MCIAPLLHTCLQAKQPVHKSCEHSLLSIVDMVIQITGYKHSLHSDIVPAPGT